MVKLYKFFHNEDYENMLKKLKGELHTLITLAEDINYESTYFPAYHRLSFSD